MTGSTAFRADHVGSLLRPEPLLQARRRREGRTLDGHTQELIYRPTLHVH